MEQSRLTINIRHSALHDPEKAIQWVRDTRPAGLVLELISTNDLSVAMRYRAALPEGSRLVVRVKDGEDGAYWDKQGDHYIPPTLFLNRYGAFGKNGLTLQVLCEPSFGGDPEKRARMIEWLVEVVTMATVRGIAVCAYNGATGNPSVNNTLSWEGFEDLIVAINRDPAHILGLHIYHRHGIPLGWMDSIGPLVSFCKDRGITVCRCCVTEHGAEDQGGERDDGWKGPLWNLSEFGYVDMLFEDYQSLWEQYVEMGVLEWLALFAATDNGWQSFNVMPILDELKTAIEDGWFVTELGQGTRPLFFTYLADVSIKFVSAAPLRQRVAPDINADPVGSVPQGDYRNIFITGKVWDEAFKWFWYEMTINGVRGWSAGISGVTITPVMAVPPPEVKPDYGKEFTEVLNLLRNMVGQTRKMADEWEDTLDLYGNG
jgi:hypothetical protein